MIRHPHRFYTRTMAELYLAQGYLTDAEAAYRFLLEKNPDQTDLQESLDRIVGMRGGSGTGDLVQLMKTWASLLRREKQRSGVER
jgi:hypothetical protein